MSLLELVVALLGATVLKALADRVTNRIAEWILPDGQPVTFRIAWLLARVAESLAPSTEARWCGWTSSGPSFHVRTIAWTGAAEAWSDLQDDLAADIRLIAPLRLVAPLLIEVARARLGNGYAHLQRWWAVGCFVALLSLVAIGALILYPLRPLVEGIARLWRQYERSRSQLVSDQGEYRIYINPRGQRVIVASRPTGPRPIRDRGSTRVM